MAEAEFWLAIRQFRAALSANDAIALQQLADTWQTVGVSLADDIAKVYQKAGGLTAIEIANLNSYQKLLAATKLQIDSVLPSAQTIITNSNKTAALLGINYSNQIAAAVGMSGALLPVGAVNSLLVTAQAGKPLAMLLANTYGSAGNGILQQMLINLAKGVNPKTAAKNIVNLGLSDGLNAMQMLCRDQFMRAMRAGTFAQYENLGVKKFMRISARQIGRTCPACLALDGKIYLTAEAADFAAHIQCRCVAIPIPDGGLLFDAGSGTDWYNNLDDDQKRKAVGAKRKLLLDNGLDFSAMAGISDDATWGKRSYTIPVRNL